MISRAFNDVPSRFLAISDHGKSGATHDTPSNQTIFPLCPMASSRLRKSRQNHPPASRRQPPSAQKGSKKKVPSERPCGEQCGGLGAQSPHQTGQGFLRNTRPKASLPARVGDAGKSSPEWHEVILVRSPPSSRLTALIIISVVAVALRHLRSESRQCGPL